MDLVFDFSEKACSAIGWLCHLPMEGLKAFSRLQLTNHMLVWGSIITDDVSKVARTQHVIKSLLEKTSPDCQAQKVFSESLATSKNFLADLDQEILTLKVKLESMEDSAAGKKSLKCKYIFLSVLRAGCKWSVVRNAKKTQRFKILRDTIGKISDAGMNIISFFDDSALLLKYCRLCPEIGLVAMITMISLKKNNADLLLENIMVILCDAISKEAISGENMGNVETQTKAFMEEVKSNPERAAAAQASKSKTLLGCKNMSEFLAASRQKAKLAGLNPLVKRLGDLHDVAKEMEGEKLDPAVIELVADQITRLGFPGWALMIRSFCTGFSEI